MAHRTPTEVIAAQAASDGAGVRLARSVGTRALPMVDPFLMLDEFRSDEPSDYLAGFPDHPHRGFETVTIMLAGSMQHKDSVGNTGNLEAGSVQWMTAGRGIIHSEMPQQENGLMWGFQLWVNLPSSHKLAPPRYQDIPAEQIPTASLPDGTTVRVIAGHALGLEGPVSGSPTEPVLLDVRVPEGVAFAQTLPARHNAFVYVYQGSVAFIGDGGETTRTVPRGHAAVLGVGDVVKLRAEGADASALIIAGKPLGEPVARYGPFVMNTPTEIEQAFEDYRQGRFAT